MAFKVTQTHVWAAEIEDQPGGLARKLSGLAAAGANLECVIARRKPEKAGTGVVFVTPLKGKKVLAAAQADGFQETQRLATLKIEGPDRAGIGMKIAQAVGDAGISLRGMSAAVLGAKYVCYLAFDTEADAKKATGVVRALGRK
jgi:hypothetical protein